MWVVRAGEEARFYDDLREIELLQLAGMNLETFLSLERARAGLSAGIKHPNGYVGTRTNSI
jgi:hypothetical protein